MPIAMSDKQREYFDKIEKDVEAIYEVAKKARLVGLDPSLEVECPPAKDMAGRVEKLVGPTGIGEIIREWIELEYDQDEICFRAMDMVLEGKFGEITKEEAVDLAIRVALAIKTEGVVSAPLEGIGKIIIRDNKTGGEPYLALYFAGPIRAAGGTVQAFAVLCAEHVRQKLNIAPWTASEDEVGRFVEEVKLYDRILNLQYPSTPEELAFAVQHLKVELNGEPTESQEVSAHRNLPRIETNFVRGGPCLVLNDGVLLKSKKIQKIIDKREIAGWEWLKKLKKLAHSDNKKKLEDDGKDKSKDYGGDTYKGKKSQDDENVKQEKEIVTPSALRRQELDKKNPPLNKFIADIIAGRPVFAYPSAVGGHRIRYGRSRNTGLAACGVHPSQMLILEKFMAVGTQIRIERPGKSGSTMPVTSIEPPIVLMKNGDVKQLWSIAEANKMAEKRLVDKILFVGDMLFGYGEFAENNHTIIPSGYVEEWWAVELEEKIKILIENHQNPYENLPKNLSSDIIDGFTRDPFNNIPNPIQTLEISTHFDVGLHPRYLDHWGNLDGLLLIDLIKIFNKAIKKFFKSKDLSLEKAKTKPWLEISELFESGLLIPNSPNIKAILEKVFVVHDYEGDFLRLHPGRSLIFLEIFGLGKFNSSTAKDEKKLTKLAKNLTALELFEHLTTIKIPDKAPYYMGSRMGRPEKAKERKMKPPVHVLFPIGHNSKLQRCFQNAIAVKYIEVDVCIKKCEPCSLKTFLNLCPKCGNHTELQKICPSCQRIYPKTEMECPNCNSSLRYSSKKKIPLKKYFDYATSKFHKTIPLIKGVKGMTSEFKIPEPIEKGILRAINGVWVYKDGTIRADATDIPLTHFTCKEISITVEDVLDLGYDLDTYGNPITDENQVIELKVQDVLLTHHLGDYFINVAKFVDDELEYLYHLPRFYNITEKHDLIGHYMAGLAPHTSAAIVGRLIGFTYAESGYAHPFWHAGKRRNCFPSQSEIMVLIEGKLNRISIKDLYDSYFEGESFESKVYQKSNPCQEIQAISFNNRTNKTEPTPIRNVIKAPSPDHLIQFSLRTGRVFETTPDHPVLIVENNKIVTKKALEIQKGDHFLIPKIDIPTVDIVEFDILREIQDEIFRPYWDDIAIRGINQFTKQIIEKRGLKATAELLAINKKTLHNYYSSRDSIPYSVLMNLMKLDEISFENIPYCNIGFKRDHTFIPRRIKVSSFLTKLIGYYIAEGFYREGEDTYQVDFAASEMDIQEDMIEAIRNIFGEGFKIYRNENRLTLSSHMLYLVFKDVFKLSNKARTKRIPIQFLQLPKEKLASLLAACFSGDGGVDVNQPHIHYSSFSYDLVKDIDTALLRFGIFSGINRFLRNDTYENKIRIYGKNYQKYKKLIGFSSKRKANLLIQGEQNLKPKKMPQYEDHKLVAVMDIKTIPSKEKFVYSLHAENHHSILINENILTHQCDGDEDGIMLLMDCLLNFSRYYLPSKLGGKMDAPLVISIRLDPREVDGESHNVDYSAKYPLQFFLDSQNYVKPGVCEAYIKLYKHVLNTEAQYEGCQFTHPTKNINLGPRKSAYTLFDTMEGKIESQLWLAKNIRSVNAQDVAKKIISSHFAPDILGNLRSFSTQKFRCIKCGDKYRRIPLSGKCNSCNGKLLMTVTAGGIKKYLPKALRLVNEFDLGAYTQQRYELIQTYVESLTNNPRIKQKTIASFFK
jgi:DNA polymerase II large subunit